MLHVRISKEIFSVISLLDGALRALEAVYFLLC